MKPHTVQAQLTPRLSYIGLVANGMTAPAMLLEDEIAAIALAAKTS